VGPDDVLMMGVICICLAQVPRKCEIGRYQGGGRFTYKERSAMIPLLVVVM